MASLAPDEETSLLVPPAERVSAPEGSDEPVSSRGSACRHRTFRLAGPGPLGSVPHLRWLALGIAVVVGVALFIVAATGKPAHRSGLPWASGVYARTARRPEPRPSPPGAVVRWTSWTPGPPGPRGRKSTIRPGSISGGRISRTRWPSGCRCCRRTFRESHFKHVPTERMTRTGTSSAQSFRPTVWALDHSAGLGVQRQLVCLAGYRPRHVGALLAADRHLRALYRPGPAMGLGRQPRGVWRAGRPGPRVSGKRLREHDRDRQLRLWPSATTAAGWQVSSTAPRA